VSAVDTRELPRHAAGGASFSWWGMVLLITTEAMLFVSLFGAYFYLRFTNGPVWPPDGIAKPDLVLPLIMSVILWSSSIPVHLADAGVKKGNQRALRYGLLVAFLLGVAFLVVMLAIEWPEKIAEFLPTDNSYGAIFYTLTGLHGTHVVVGLMISAFVQVRAWKGDYDELRHVPVQNFALYWHFVDAMWVLILATVYLSPHFG
jgi:cytochrome c oxidase subunit III